MGRDIPSLECAESRISRYACPADCPYNTFGPRNHSLLENIERQVFSKIGDWIEAGLKTDAVGGRGLDLAFAKGDPLATTHRILDHLFWTPDAEGITPYQRYRDAGLPGFRNDARVYMDCLSRGRMGLWEVRRIQDGPWLELADFLTPGATPFLVFDDALVRTACRYDLLIGPVIQLPHYALLPEGGFTIGTVLGTNRGDFFHETVRHLRGPSETEALRQWLRAHKDVLEANLVATRFACLSILAQRTAAPRWHAFYEVRGRADEAVAILNQEPHVVPVPDFAEFEDEETVAAFDEARTWIDPDPPAPNKLPGMIYISPRSWRLSAANENSLKELRTRFEGLLGTRMAFVKSLRDEDLSIGTPPAAGVVPVETIVERARESRQYETFARKLTVECLDLPDPYFGDATPRAAALDPNQRGSVEAWIKDRIRESDGWDLSAGFVTDINWLPRELGFPELILDPPPRREPPPEQDFDADEDDDDDEDEDEDLDDGIGDKDPRRR